MPRKRKSSGGLNVKAAFMAVAGLLIGLVIGVPVLLALFSEGGAFNDLTELPTSGALADNQYSGILSAIILLIPLIVVAFFVWKFMGDNVLNFTARQRGKYHHRKAKRYMDKVDRHMDRGDMDAAMRLNAKAMQENRRGTEIGMRLKSRGLRLNSDDEIVPDRRRR